MTTAEKVLNIDKIPDLVLKNAQVIDVFTGKIEKMDVAIAAGKVIGLGSFEGVREYDCQGAFLCPGFIDSHVHIESSMSTPTEFARIVLPKGTTTVIADPHEIANVAGLDGLRYMKASADASNLSVFFMFPSCVPCVDFAEVVQPMGDIEAQLAIDENLVLGLGEVMDYVSVIGKNPAMMLKIDIFEGKPVDGHAPGVVGRDLDRYVAAGITTDHECVDFDEAKEKLKRGMKVQLRVGSAASNINEMLEKIAVAELPMENFLFCTDDKHTENILERGHINYNARLAVRAGWRSIDAVRAATINAAVHYGLSGKGAIAPGYDADLVLFSDLLDFEPITVFAGGIEVADVSCEKIEVPVNLKNTVHIVELDAQMLAVTAENCPVMTMPEGQLLTKLTYEEVPQESGLFIPQKNFAKIVCVERHKSLYQVCATAVKDFGLQRGALASSVGHDSHNIIAIGMSDDDILLAINTLKTMGGGFALIDNKEVIATIALPVCGLMSDGKYENIVEQQRKLLAELYRRGISEESDPLIRISFFGLPVIPEVRILPNGIFNVAAWSYI